MHFQRTSGKHLLFYNTKLFGCSCSVFDIISTIVLLIFSDDIIALLEIYISDNMII